MLFHQYDEILGNTTVAVLYKDDKGSLDNSLQVQASLRRQLTAACTLSSARGKGDMPLNLAIPLDAVYIQ